MRSRESSDRFASNRAAHECARSRAFTLIELLVVISLIVLLISMLMPALGKAKENARTASCLTQTRQLAMAWDAYTTESNGYMLDYTLQAKSRVLWTQALRPYFGEDHAALVCPATDDPDGSVDIGRDGIAGIRFGNARRTWVEGRPGYNAPPPFNRSSYTYNGNMFGRSSYNTDEQRYIKRTSIFAPDNSPILGDGVWRSATPGGAGAIKAFPLDLSNPENGFTGGAYDSVYRWVTNRHGKVTNVSFADAHAESVQLNHMWSLQWHRTYEPAAYVD